MPSTCPDCGSQDTLSFIAEVGQEVCADCGTVLQELHLYEPTSIHDLAYAIGGPADQRLSGSSDHRRPPSTLHLWHPSTEEWRRRNDYNRKPEVDARIRGTLAALGSPGLFGQVEFLFQRAREASWKQKHTLPPPSLDDELTDASGSLADSNGLPRNLVPPPVRWGSLSLNLAAACCYAVLRREGVRTDLDAVAEAAQLPLAKVRRAFRWLRLLVSDAIRDIKLVHPDAYIHGILAFFRVQLALQRFGASSKIFRFLKPLQAPVAAGPGVLPQDPARILYNTPFEAVEATALEVCNFSWPLRSHRVTEARPAAFAASVLAMEAHVKSPAPVYEIFRFVQQALMFDLRDTGDLRPLVDGNSSRDHPLHKNAMAQYVEICASLRTEALKMPWLTDLAPIGKNARPKKRKTASASSGAAEPAELTELVRRDLIVHALDVLQVTRAVTANRAAEAAIEVGAATGTHVHARSASQSVHTKHVGRSLDEASDGEVDLDELECFVSTAQTSDSASGMSHDISDQPAGSFSGDTAEAWPSVLKRLEAARVLPATELELRDSSRTHPIDLLTDEQVDNLLFGSNELSSIFRTDPVERAALERAKVALGDWERESAHQRDIEITALARRAERDRELEQLRSQGNVGADRDGPAGIASVKVERSRRPKPPKHSHKDSAEKPSSKRKRTREPAVVSLHDQLDESDWSE